MKQIESKEPKGETKHLNKSTRDDDDEKWRRRRRGEYGTEGKSFIAAVALIGGLGSRLIKP
jgi:hypothetical protein